MKRNRRVYDPTGFQAIQNITDETRRFYKLVYTIYYICELAGFDVGERIVLIDMKTGRIWE